MKSYLGVAIKKPIQVKKLKTKKRKKKVLKQINELGKKK